LYLDPNCHSHLFQFDEIDKLQILVSVVRFRPGPPRNTKTTFGWFFHLGLDETMDPKRTKKYYDLISLT